MLAGFFLTNVGNGVYALSVGYLLYQLTDSVLGYALVGFSEFGFKLATQGVSRFDHRRAAASCMFMDGIRASCLVAAALLVWSEHPITAVVVATVAVNAVKPFYITATFRLATELNRPEQLERYNAAFLTAKQGGYLCGAGLFAVAVAWLPLAAVMAANAGTYLLMMAVMAALAARPATAARSPRKSINGWAVSWQWCRDPSVLRLAWCASHDALLVYLLSLWVLAASQTQYKEVGPTALAALQVCLVAGTGSSLLRTRTTIGRSEAAVRRAAIVLVVGELVALIALALTTNLVVACALLFVCGMASAQSVSIHMSRLMRAAEGSVRGRLAGFQLLVLSATVLLTLPLATWGLDADVASVPFGLAGIAAIMLAVIASGQSSDAPPRVETGNS